MTSLHDHLADLAEDAPTGGLPGSPAPDLWALGVRRARRVRAAGLAAAVAVLVVVSGVGVWWVGPQQREVTPADVPFGDLHLPRTVEVPSAWADGTDETGPPGPLAAVSMAPRNRAEGLWGVREGFAPYGVSAVDGSLVFLDLQDTDLQALGGYGLVLSPDGTKVGYARYVEGSEGAEVAGLGVYDTLTGETRLLDDPRAPQLNGAEGADIDFSGDSRYLATSYSRSGSTGTRDHELVVWDVETGELEVAEGPGRYWLPNMGSAPSGIVWARGRVTHVFDPVTGRTTSERSAFEVIEPSYGPGERTFAAVAFGERQRDPWRLFAGTGPGDARELAVDFEPDAVVGWRDPEHVVLRELPGGEVHVVDVRTGESQRETLAAPGTSAMVPSVAADLLANSLVDGAPAPVVADPRRPWWAGGGLAALVAVAALGVTVVRRRRARA